MLKIKDISKKVIILLLIMISIIPFSVFAADYNTSLEEDRKKVQEILPDTTFDSENRPSVGVATVIKKNNTIYFENVNNWTDVSIYLFNDNGDSLKEWPGVSMEKLNDEINSNEIYRYVFDSDNEIYNKVIFTGNDSNGNRKQTKNLAFIGNGLYFSISTDADDDSKYDGNWFLYDKSSMNNYIKLMDNLSEYKSYITEDSYANMDEVITTANDVIAMYKIRANFYEVENTNLYINEYYETLYKMTSGINNLKIDTGVLEKAISEAESKDTTLWSDDAKKELSDAIASSKATLQELKDNPNIFSVNPNTSIEDAINQFKKNIDTIDNIKMSINELKEVVDSNDNGIINDLTTNPETSSVIFMILIVILIAVVAVFVYLYYNKQDKKKK